MSFHINVCIQRTNRDDSIITNVQQQQQQQHRLRTGQYIKCSSRQMKQKAIQWMRERKRCRAERICLSIAERYIYKRHKMHATLRTYRTSGPSVCGTWNDEQQKIIDSCFFCWLSSVYVVYMILCVYISFFLCFASFCCLHIVFALNRWLSVSSHNLLFKCILIEKRNQKTKCSTRIHT